LNHRRSNEIANKLPLFLSGFLLFLSSWIVIPAPTFSLLPLAVGAPEISPVLAMGNAIALLGAIPGLKTSNFCRSAIGCSLAGLILCSLPLLQLPIALQRANAAMETALGKDYLVQIPPAVRTTLRRQPFVLKDLFVGLPTASVRHTPNVRFTTFDGFLLTLEIYRPPRRGRYPAIAVIYGGAWQSGNPSQNAVFNRYMAARGYTVVAIDYRHAPNYRFPVQLQDVQAALQFIHQNAATYEIDPTRIALMGWSAGAHLAMLAAYQSDDTIPFRAVVNYYGPVDLIQGYNDLPFPDPLDVRAVLEAFLGGSPTQVPTQYQRASPIYYVKPQLPPTLLVYGSRDHIVKVTFGEQLYERLRSTGNAVVFLKLPWAEHAFDLVFRGLGNQVALYYTERFLARTLQN
jgi:acetyl esterase/lipase